ncbi:MAG: glucose-6-phosphate dehydrogenase [Nitrospirota bacterium]
MNAADPQDSAKAVCTAGPRPDVCGIERPAPCGIVIFGAGGDLSKRKLIPSLYRLYINGHLPDGFFMFGSDRMDMDDAGFHKVMEEAVRAALPDRFSPGTWKNFSDRLFYVSADFNSREFFLSLPSRLNPLEKKFNTGGNRIFYMAIPPVVYETVIRHLGETGLASEGNGYSRVVVEKPFGFDMESSRHLNSIIGASFTESQTFRMDHYLAKENVQNILMFRFANSIFEPLWNRRYIDHVEITISETLGVEHRAAYYESAGVLRDMFQNHILQLLSLTAMEPPAAFASERVREEKAKVFRSIRPIPLDMLSDYVALGQYGAGNIDGKEVAAYRDEPGVNKKSAKPTYAAMKLYIDNWRWSGVPFYMRSGKRLSKGKAEIAIRFRAVPHLMFSHLLSDRIDPNLLVLRVQPDEGISLQFQTKMPDSRACLQPVLMDFKYEKVFLLDAYERVLLDCMTGDQMLFVSGEIEEQTWGLLSPVITKLEEMGDGFKFPNYAAGSNGPGEADVLMSREGRQWRGL